MIFDSFSDIIKQLLKIFLHKRWCISKHTRNYYKHFLSESFHYFLGEKNTKKLLGVKRVKVT